MVLVTRTISAGTWWLATYLVGAVGALLAVAGGNWDVASHIIGIPETFFTPAHTVLYSGVALMVLVIPLGIVAYMRAKSMWWEATGLMHGLYLASVGTAMQFFAGGFDFWWHESFGFDAVLFSPPHLTLVTGIALNALGISLGTARLLTHVRRTELTGRLASPRLWTLLTLTAFTALWLALNGLIYFFLDLRGIGFTFKLWGEGLRQAVPLGLRFTVLAIQIALLAITGMGMLTTVRRILAMRGSSTILAAAVVAVWSAAVGVPFRAYLFLVLYAATLLPLALVELRAETFPGRWTAVLLGPVAFALNGWLFLSLVEIISEFTAIVLWMLPTFLTGAAGFRVGTRLGNWLGTGFVGPRSPTM